ncbi:MAG: hypothetical protein MZW92_47590 [Comamonadaceae bacterium]|nr:hypothetical protein [Comamonadaceae bacterium]
MGLLPQHGGQEARATSSTSRSIGVLTNAPRFSAYVASQGGAGRLARAARSSEFADQRHRASPPSTCRWCARR